jgi:WD40 repeat protein
VALEDKIARLWALPTGKLLRQIEGHSATLTNITFSHDGKFILTGSEDKTARLWDAQTGQIRQIFWGHTDAVTTVAFSPDGTRILTGGRDHVVRFWETVSGDLLETFKAHNAPIRFVAFSADGKTVISSDEKMIKWRLIHQNPTGQSWSFGVHQQEDILNYKLTDNKIHILTISDIKNMGVRTLSESMCLEHGLYQYSAMELKQLGVQIEPEDDVEKGGGTAQNDRVNRF